MNPTRKSPTIIKKIQELEYMRGSGREKGSNGLGPRHELQADRKNNSNFEKLKLRYFDFRKFSNISKNRMFQKIKHIVPTKEQWRDLLRKLPTRRIDFIL